LIPFSSRPIIYVHLDEEEQGEDEEEKREKKSGLINGIAVYA
jgi:hypothetical protein